MSIQDLEKCPIPLPLDGDLSSWIASFWQHQLETAETVPMEQIADTSKHAVPLTRVRKIMKLENVKMISVEAPILLSFACQIFVAETTARAWSEADVQRRRTVQRSDYFKAIKKNEMFDFLIDLIPREDDQESRGRKRDAPEEGT